MFPTIDILLAEPVEISTQRGANILFHAIYFFNINTFKSIKVLEGIRKKMLTFIQFPNS